MVFKRFRLNCVLRVGVLAATIFLFFYLFSHTTYHVSTVIVGVIIFIQIYSLIDFIEKTNRDLTFFLDSIRHSDFTRSFTGRGLGPSFTELHQAFSEVIQDFQKARAEKEEHARYLQTVVEHIGVGLVAFQKDGSVELINKAAKRLLHVLQLKNIQALAPISVNLVEILRRLRAGQKALVKVTVNNELLQLAIYATEFRLREQHFTLVSIQNIHSELEEKEMEAWQNLIRVLTHEIMNSVTPIASLAGTANDILENANLESETRVTESEAMRDISDALQTIERRSLGLIRFVETYRKLTRIPTPSFSTFPVSELFHRVQQLLTAQVESKQIEFITQITPVKLELTADPELIEQVLLNLLLNAVPAVETQPMPRIELRGLIDAGSRVQLQVADNGSGISKEIQEKIFIPFFTTKKSGSGIGLSLSRQIMRLHQGSISVNSAPDQGAIFSLKF